MQNYTYSINVRYIYLLIHHKHQVNVGKYAIYRSYEYRNPFEPINVAEGILFTLLTWILTKGKPTWQWKTQRFEHVSLPGGNSMVFFLIPTFPIIETGEIPASYVSLSDGRGCFFSQKTMDFSSPQESAIEPSKKEGWVNLYSKGCFCILQIARAIAVQ